MEIMIFKLRLNWWIGVCLSREVLGSVQDQHNVGTYVRQLKMLMKTQLTASELVS